MYVAQLNCYNKQDDGLLVSWVATCIVVLSGQASGVVVPVGQKLPAGKISP